MSTNYGWIITKDLIYEPSVEKDDVGAIGPSTINIETVKRLSRGEGVRFRLYDDDDILYYEGRLISDDSETDVSPLYEFGMPNAGCTKMAFFENGEWVPV